MSVDALEFSEKARQARLADTLEEQLRDCVAACRMYTGEFLPSMIGEDWVPCVTQPAESSIFTV